MRLLPGNLDDQAFKRAIETSNFIIVSISENKLKAKTRRSMTENYEFGCRFK